MNAMQYEELCRQFLSEKLAVPKHKIESRRMPAPARPGEKARVRQVDLCWETETQVGRYLTIADAKYRARFKIDQDAVVTLQRVKEDVGAQKAMIIASTEFTRGAIETAKHFGIALHILRPMAKFNGLHRSDREIMQQRLAELAKASRAPLYRHTVVCKAFERTTAPPHPRSPRPPSNRTWNRGFTQIIEIRKRKENVSHRGPREHRDARLNAAACFGVPSVPSVLSVSFAKVIGSRTRTRDAKRPGIPCGCMSDE